MNKTHMINIFLLSLFGSSIFLLLLGLVYRILAFSISALAIFTFASCLLVYAIVLSESSENRLSK
ncbi:MAG: hypothetical protein GX638_16460 [Crenarchaeota archaeon]|nr:hypothetical protein [Thermoproteota archaeon]